MALAGILFDKDGTLIDFDLTWGPASVAVMRTLARGDDAAFTRLAAANGVDPLACTIDPASPLVAGSSASYGWLWAQALGCADTPAPSELVMRRSTVIAASSQRRAISAAVGP
jgi:phosphoglycolate phosphatase